MSDTDADKTFTEDDQGNWHDVNETPTAEQKAAYRAGKQKDKAGQA